MMPQLNDKDDNFGAVGDDGDDQTDAAQDKWYSANQKKEVTMLIEFQYTTVTYTTTRKARNVGTFWRYLYTTSIMRLSKQEAG